MTNCAFYVFFKSSFLLYSVMHEEDNKNMGKGDFDMIQIKYDIVGSFLRPEAIKKARAEFKSGAITREDLKKVEDEEIAKLVKKRSGAWSSNLSQMESSAAAGGIWTG